MIYFVLLLIFFCAFDSLTLLPFYHVGGVFNINDVGNALIALSLFGLILGRIGKRELLKLKNPFTWFILLYLFFIGLQISLATINFGQTLIDGIIIARHQLYYLSFFLFLFAFDGRDKVYRFMNLLTLFCLAIVVLAFVNYFGPTIFHGAQAEGFGERAGITRASVPGASILVVGGLWNLVRYTEDKKASTWSFLFFLFFFAGIIFRQTRMRIIAFTTTVLIMLFRNRRFKIFTGLISIIVIAFIVLNFTMKQNILLSPFKSTVEDVSEEQGTWQGRVTQIKADWESIKEHPILGNGGIVFRGVDMAVTKDILLAVTKFDLGYIHFVKFFGVPGAIWILLFIAIFYVKLARIIKEPGTDMVMAKFSGYMFSFIVISEFTLDSFTSNTGILLLCMTLATLFSSRGLGKKNSPTHT